MTRAAPPIFPLPGHRTMAEVIADEAMPWRQHLLKMAGNRKRRSAAA